MDPALKALHFSSYLRLIQQNSNFRRLWAAQIVSEIGDCFYSLAVYSLFLESTGQAGSVAFALVLQVLPQTDRKSTRLNSSHEWISYAVFCLKKKKTKTHRVII